MAMKVIAMPARVLSKAARGVLRRSRSATNAPLNSIKPLPRQAIRPSFQAYSALPVRSKAGFITKKTYTSSEGVLIP